MPMEHMCSEVLAEFRTTGHDVDTVRQAVNRVCCKFFESSSLTTSHLLTSIQPKFNFIRFRIEGTYTQILEPYPFDQDQQTQKQHMPKDTSKHKSYLVQPICCSNTQLSAHVNCTQIFDINTRTSTRQC